MEFQRISEKEWINFLQRLCNMGAKEEGLEGGAAWGGQKKRTGEGEKWELSVYGNAVRKPITLHTNFKKLMKSRLCED